MKFLVATLVAASIVLPAGPALASTATTAVVVPAPAGSQRRAVELTYLKSVPGRRAALRKFIELNWFAMDAVARARGLMVDYRLLDAGADAGDWNLLVIVTYPNDLGYDGIRTEFEAIRAAHTPVPVDGRTLRDLGSIVKSLRLYEEVAAPAAGSLSWLVGSWCGGAAGSRVIESWSDADGGLMLAVNREVRADGRAAFEFLRIELRADPPAYVSQPGGAPPTRFPLLESGPGHVIFANPAHDFPKRIGYRRAGDALVAWIDDGTAGGKRAEWRWERCTSGD